MNIRAKFHCTEVAKRVYGGKDQSEVIKGAPVYGGNPEDNAYSKATPSGSIELVITNPTCFGVLRPGQRFYLDITPLEGE